jgi:hypothetical protein
MGYLRPEYPPGLRDEDYCIWCGDWKASAHPITDYAINGNRVTRDAFEAVMGKLDDEGHPPNMRSPMNPTNKLESDRLLWEMTKPAAGSPVEPDTPEPKKGIP